MTDPSYTPDPRRWRILAVLTTAMFASLIGVTIVNVALPSIQDGVGATESELQWVLTGYALTFGIVLVSAGRAGDVYGRAPLFIAGVAIFTASSVGSGLAQDPLTLNIARAFQGVGSGLLNPQVVGAIQQYFRGAERARAFAVIGATAGISVAIGPVFGGFLIDALGPDIGWRATFLVNVPVGILTIILTFLWFPKPMLNKNRERDPAQEPPNRDLDPVGAVLLGIAVLAVLLPFVERGRGPLIWLNLLLGVGMTLVWVWWENRQKRRGREPMVDLEIFQTASFTNGTLIITAFFMGMTSISVLIILYLQDGLGYSAFTSGLMSLPSALGSALAALWGGKKVPTYGRYVVIGGIYCTLFGVLASALVIWLRSGGHVSEWWLLLTLTFVGTGQGAAISPNQSLTLADVPVKYAGSSGGIMQTGQRIGTTIGIALITTIAFAVLPRSDWTTAAIAGLGGVTVMLIFSVAVAHRDLHLRGDAGGVTV